ncbi:Xaa-Pro aminopeptidase [Clostridium saccharoperbutylacetonicum]|uniref:Xaa-Pro aminopeptidase n=1 Tax=Clostridium saccharoperbutylacetonicum N1-4(HMT) TaxID=931276 RepID=M1LM64_9CLOT|nr:aminopeptidase P family protein [Clostridium saccharoperbutylacetonicum]AGF53900.1 Xaa-Pro aminopeptidase [Clostridium saccharoperbutylacetonicum N1-4(HMT)]NRT59587.1 Xaa-Pro aminopeptidase [Clostridium saccharoperbutylacetonicum]NSB28779.1 Xaa-Pro aminopeptidase [Clostridium saccharoperbutylacetonicum]NSB42270.1 Xaa-Pro aminopeptidase [Clostridium saccharoperbutylacetonicum]
MKVSERIQKLRELMKKEKIDYYIVPSEDFHQSEYVAECFKARAYITGFTGSAGTALIGLEKAILWTDGRYFIQANQQLEGSGVELFKMRIPGWPTLEEWLMENVSEGQTLGFDGRVLPVNRYKDILKIKQNKNINIAMDKDLIEEIWTDKPEMPKEKVFILDTKYCGKSAKEKIQEVRNDMNKLGSKAYIISSLDDIAWLFNIRGNDVKNTPVVLSYALIDEDRAILYIDVEKISDSDKEALSREGIIIKNYEDVFEDIKEIKDSIIFDSDKVSAYIYEQINNDVKKIEELNITTKLKAIKNETEINSLKNCQLKDGVAMVRFIKWIKDNVGEEVITELSLADKLCEIRSKGELFIEESFATIAGYKEHAAMMHYSATEESAYELKKEGILLVDSGGQYFDGTTDITRSIILGKLTEEEKRDFTLVLKAHIGLMKAVFLKGTTGSNVDILSRRVLWEEGLDYKCGTGHGVGFCLSVHEGPQTIRPIPNTVELEPGMILTNEPGIYREGKHGIRTENIMLVVPDKKDEEFGEFYKFETMSYCPIDLEGIDVNLLTDYEKEWLNDYHKETYEKLSPFLNDDEKQFLKEETKAI